MLHLCWTLAVLLPAFPIDEGTGKKYDLAFTPKDGAAIVIQYWEDTEWDYQGDDMKGKLHTELTLRWRIQRKEGAKGFTGKATFDRVLYQGQGEKRGKAFSYDLEWTAKEGYLRGQGGEADRKWIASEIREGIILEFDDRAACSPGKC